ncbi:MAG TPA: spore protease YyaC [Bacillus sp. (in: firmicutes)]|nr:spore protease YyaC [Bacillus sp. (in: firmicutes)]
MPTLNNVDKPHKMSGNIIPFNHNLAPLFIRNSLHSIIPKDTQHLFVLCIGCNIVNGDSLGPFVGTLLHGLYPDHLTVIGNLQYPLDAKTLVPELSQLSLPQNSFVVAIDSICGTEELVHSIIVRDGPLLPGSGVGTILPYVGDCSIMGVVLEDSPAVKRSLPYTNLHLIYTMATNIAMGISLAVRQYFKYPSYHPILPSKS